MSIDTSRVRGDFKKRAVIWSNDSERLSVAVYLNGRVKPRVSLNPGGYIALYGNRGKVPPENLEIVNHRDRPLKILGITTDLSGRIQWRLEEVEPGYRYRLVVEDVSPTAGNYSGRLRIRTDDPEKPEIPVVINGRVAGEGS